MPKLSNNKIYWIGFIIIVIIYSLYNLYFIDVNYYNSIPRKLRHVEKFIPILIVYGVGTLTLKNHTADWMMYIWHLLHLIIIALLLVIGIYDWSLGEVPAPVRNVAGTLFEFLISPLMYIAVGILNSKFNRADKK